MLWSIMEFRSSLRRSAPNKNILGSSLHIHNAQDKSQHFTQHTLLLMNSYSASVSCHFFKDSDLLLKCTSFKMSSEIPFLELHRHFGLVLKLVF